jgi:hypothetical protein
MAMWTSDDTIAGSMLHPYTNGRGVRVGPYRGPNPNAPFLDAGALRLAGLNRQPWIPRGGRRLPVANTNANLRAISSWGGLSQQALKGLTSSPSVTKSSPWPSSGFVRLYNGVQVGPGRSRSGNYMIPSWPNPRIVRLRGR